MPDRLVLTCRQLSERQLGKLRTWLLEGVTLSRLLSVSPLSSAKNFMKLPMSTQANVFCGISNLAPSLFTREIQQTKPYVRNDSVRRISTALFIHNTCSEAPRRRRDDKTTSRPILDTRGHNVAKTPMSLTL